jgi:DDB1- and CUL4-associated factor 11
MDCSLMTYQGHRVLRTLIRCHFSPIESTGQQYIYSGSADGRIHVRTFTFLSGGAKRQPQIWSLDGRVVQVLDRAKTLPPSFSPSEPEWPELHRGPLKNTCVRDVSWHSEVRHLCSFRHIPGG